MQITDTVKETADVDLERAMEEEEEGQESEPAAAAGVNLVEPQGKG